MGADEVDSSEGNRPPHDEEPSRTRPGEGISKKMSTLARRDTGPEMALRRELHRRGMRFRVQVRVPTNRRRTIDVALTRARIAVMVDGCFWHGCPEHGGRPGANADWWRWKLDRNVARDRDTDLILQEDGWKVLRFWEHEDVGSCADRVEATWRERTQRAADSSGAP